MIKIDKLRKSYGNNNVLNSISLQLPNHGIIGVIGHNGAGKSTLFRCVCQLENYNGVINFEGTGKLKDNIGYLPTSPYFYPKLTGREYLTFFQTISDKKNDSNIEKWNELFQLPLEKYVEQYSTGMKKKIGFFGILLQKKSIYILDEPFNGLDLDAVLLFNMLIPKVTYSSFHVWLTPAIMSLSIDFSPKYLLLNL